MCLSCNSICFLATMDILIWWWGTLGSYKQFRLDFPCFNLSRTAINVLIAQDLLELNKFCVLNLCLILSLKILKNCIRSCYSCSFMWWMLIFHSLKWVKTAQQPHMQMQGTYWIAIELTVFWLFISPRNFKVDLQDPQHLQPTYVFIMRTCNAVRVHSIIRLRNYPQNASIR